MKGTLAVTGDPKTDRLLNTDGTALLIGMLLDQQVPMEWAFAGPATLKARLGHLDAKKIAAMDVDAFVDVCREKPAIHRFPASMGKRIHELCVALAEQYKGERGERLEGCRHRRRALRAAPGPPGLRRRESEDLPGAAGEAGRRAARGMASSSRRVR